MANPSTRQQLIDWCLRRLGHPVIEINVDDDQVEDRIDEALQFYREYHYDAVELVYLKEQITNSSITITGITASSFQVGETITGSSSGATTKFVSASAANKLTVNNTSGTFTANETITGSVSGHTATLSSITLGNYDLKYIELNDSITSVVKMLPFTSRTRGIDLFDVRYQILLNDIYSIQSTDIIYYTQIQTQLQLLNDLLVGQKPIRFNRHQNRLYIDMSWEDDVAPGEYIIIEAYRVLDPATYPDIYNDMYVKRYAEQLIKMQWGNNLKKFEGVQLPGGVTLNGQKIFDEAVEEIEKIRQEVQDSFQLPVDFFTG
jgi:hypothetical protein